ncbi:MAG: hypothetical protein Q8M18_08080, partial [Bradyrhizobium sp.]|nr:hypothetical protein [Bradyrhizobium sp.]
RKAVIGPELLPGRVDLLDVAVVNLVRGAAEGRARPWAGAGGLEIAIRCLETPTRPAASSARKGPRRVVG